MEHRRERVGVAVAAAVVLLVAAAFTVWPEHAAWVIEGKFWDLLPQAVIDTWRMFNATCAAVALALTLHRLAKYRRDWTFQERHFLRGTGLYELTAVVGTLEVLGSGDAGWRLLILTIANCHVIYAGIRPPQRLTQGRTA